MSVKESKDMGKISYFNFIRQFRLLIRNNRKVRFWDLWFASITIPARATRAPG